MSAIVVPLGDTRLTDALCALYDTERERLAWLHAPQALLAGRVPLTLMQDRAGYAECVTVLQRAADGVFL